MKFERKYIGIATHSITVSNV